MNFMIFRYHNKYTHPVLYMSVNTITQGKVKLKCDKQTPLQICQASGKGTLGKEENIKTNFLIIFFFICWLQLQKLLSGF